MFFKVYFGKPCIFMLIPTIKHYQYLLNDSVQCTKTVINICIQNVYLNGVRRQFVVMTIVKTFHPIRIC